ncbi:MAG: flagellar biosynthetic protein FliO [Myxococcales bacterium]|nr:flagellar biosynthetic protein FliO [Myxococcales bacterium]
MMLPAAVGAPGPGPDPAGLSGGYGEMLVGSLLVLALVCVAAWLVVRFGTRRLWSPRGGQVLDVVARVPLEPRRSLYVVEVAGKTLLVGTSEMGLSVLSELDAEQVRARLEVAPRARGLAASFGDAIQSALARRRGGAGTGETETETRTGTGTGTGTGGGERQSQTGTGAGTGTGESRTGTGTGTGEMENRTGTGTGEKESQTGQGGAGRG